MKIKTRLTNVISMFKRMNSQEVQMYKYTLMGLLIADLVGVYWYLEMKALGIACMFVIVVFLAVFLFLEKELEGGGNMENKKEETSTDVQKEIESLEKEKKLKALNEKRDSLKKDLNKEEEYKDLTPKEDKNDLGFETGLPNVEEFQKRASKALGADSF